MLKQKPGSRASGGKREEMRCGTGTPCTMRYYAMPTCILMRRD